MKMNEAQLKNIIVAMSMIFAKLRPVNEVTATLSELRNIEGYSQIKLQKLEHQLSEMSKNKEFESYSRELQDIADALAMLNYTVV